MAGFMDTPAWQWVLLYGLFVIAYWAIPLHFILGWIGDKLLGDPIHWHPIIGFGRLIAWGEKRFNKGKYRRVKGFVYNGIILFVPAFVYILMQWALIYVVGYMKDWGTVLFVLLDLLLANVVVFYMLSGTTLIKEVRMVFDALKSSLTEGRKQVARIVGRDTEQLSEQEVRTAALETLSENLSDGVVAPLFWYMLLFVPGILIYKMCNTQDSMIGYKNARYRAYGFFSAKLDDVLNYIPARLTALLMLFSVGRLDLLPFVGKYGKAHASPNSGYPEAALAGILNCRFGGPHDYFGEEVYKPYIGEHERPLNYEDMLLATRINQRVEVMMIALVAVVHSLIAVGIYSLLN